MKTIKVEMPRLLLTNLAEYLRWASKKTAQNNNVQNARQYIDNALFANKTNEEYTQ